VSGAKVFRDRVAVGDDCAGLVDGDGSAIDVTQLVGLSGAPAGDDPGQQGCGDVAKRGVVVLAGFGHEPVVFGGQDGVVSERVPNARGIAIFTVTFMASQTGGALLRGLIADQVGLRPAVLGAAAAVGLGAVAALFLRVPETGHLDPQSAAPLLDRP
jgi:Transmembrane secretion effector